MSIELNKFVLCVQFFKFKELLQSNYELFIIQIKYYKYLQTSFNKLGNTIISLSIDIGYVFI